MSSVWIQRQFSLPARPRGFHLITGEITAELAEIASLSIGLLHLLLQHTSASLAMNENASPDVRTDLETWFTDAVRENDSYWRHTLEGPDDMPAHVKSVLIGPSLTIPVSDGSLALGTWQGIYLCEHRDHPTARRIIATLHGARRQP